jgi:ribosomal protein L37E
LALLAAAFEDHPAVISKEAAMFASLVKRVTAPFRRKRCPECGHKVHETYCDVCGYDLIEQTRTKILRGR